MNGYAVAAISTAALLALLLFLRPIFQGDPPALLFLVGVVLAAWFGGFRAGLFAAVLSVAASVHYLIEPFGSLEAVEHRERLRIVLFAGVGLLLSAMIAWLRKAEQRAMREAVHQREALESEVAERERAERLLQQSEKRWRAFVEQTPVPVAMLDRDMRYVAASRRWLADFKLEAESLIGRSHYEVFPDIPDRWREVHKRCLAGATESAEEDAFERADGTVQWLRWEILPWDGIDNAIGGIIIFSEDITARKRAEAALRQSAEELQRADRRKDEFLAMLAHELRNPLAPIRNAVNLMKRANLEPDRLEWCRDIIDKQVEHLTRLVDDLLDVSRVNQCKIELRKEPVKVQDFVQRAVETCQPWIEARQQEFSLEMPPEPLWVKGDGVRLSQVVSNLLNNASKYTGEGGRIGLGVECADSEVRIRVRDAGCGIEQSIMPHLFDLFYQADRSLDRAQGGLGIGLSLAHSVAVMHGGEVQAFSAGRGQGSEFVVRLPRLDFREAVSGRTAGHAVVGQRKLRILVVDDNRDSAESLALLLEADGHQVETAHDGLAALEAVRTGQPEVVLLDIGLPGMDGYAVARTIRQLPGLERISLFALTGYGQPGDLEKSRAAGFDEHLVKPVDFEDLERVLANTR